ncbi:type II toxin-antitoxin system PemK/MazF family toxin [Caenispirillum bisanense]|uniref:type II toxin-antitoxin system PemK/MazF family toxin n=1 Tax=Caenispirillum bisanense TaxID=414052 RepID=UPI0031DBBBF1
MTLKAITVLVDEADERTIQTVAQCLRAGGRRAGQVRDFAASIEEHHPVQGLRFMPKPGQILFCDFGLGFQRPEMVKARPVLVISPMPREKSELCVVVPISSKAPQSPMPYHYRLPDGLVPDKSYDEAWIKGNHIHTVGLHRLDRFKVGFRDYRSPEVPLEVLKAVRRCVLHATGMHLLTRHL